MNMTIIFISMDKEEPVTENKRMTWSRWLSRLHDPNLALEGQLGSKRSQNGKQAVGKYGNGEN